MVAEKDRSMKLHLTIAEEQDLLPIHEASIKILSETGCVFHSEKARDTLKKHGAKVTGKTVYFPENLVRTAMATVPSTFQWRARNATFSTIIGKGGFRLAPNAGNIYVQDLDNGRRLARLDDVRHSSNCEDVGRLWVIDSGIMLCREEDSTVVAQSKFQGSYG